MNQISIGYIDDKICDFKTTLNQIKDLKENYNLNIYLEEEELYLEWQHILNLDKLESGLFLNSVLHDRKKRVDENLTSKDMNSKVYINAILKYSEDKRIINNRPLLAIFTIEDKDINRIEFYEGNNELFLSYDMRSKELSNKELEPSFIDNPYIRPICTYKLNK